MNSEGGYSMSSNPGEDQWGQFNLNNQPEESGNDPENQESLQEKEAERAKKSIEASINDLNAKLKDLESSYAQQKAAGNMEAVKTIAEEYQKTFQELALIKDGVGNEPERAESSKEEKINAIAEKGNNVKGFKAYKGKILMMMMTGMAMGNFLAACAGAAGVGNNSGPSNIGNLTDRGFPSSKDPSYGAVVEVPTAPSQAIESQEQEKSYVEYTGYEVLDQRLAGKIFNGSDLKGCWDDRASKAEVMANTGRTVNNDFMTPQAIYDEICVDPANPTPEEEMAVSKYGALAMPEKALFVLRDGMGLSEFQNMTNKEAVEYLKTLPPNSEEFQHYVDLINKYYDNVNVEKITLKEAENRVLENIPEEYRDLVMEWLAKHHYVNGNGNIEAMNLPTGENDWVFVYTYEELDEDGNVINKWTRMELKKCRNDLTVSYKNGEFKLISGAGGEETGSGWEPTGDEPTGAEPTGAEPTGDEPTGDEPTGTEPTGDEPTGDEPTGTEPTGDEPTGDEPTGAEPTGYEPTGDEPTGGSEHTPKDPEKENDPTRKGDGDPQELDVDVTPPTTEEDDKKPIEDLKKREEEEKKKKEEEEKRKKEQEEAEKKAKEEAEKRRQEEEERKKKEEEEKKADEAKKKAEEEAQKEQEKRAEEERKRQEEEEKRRKEQEEADKREEENRKKAEDDSNKNADDRQNDWENGNY